MRTGQLRGIVSRSSILHAVLTLALLCGGALSLHASGIQQVSVFSDVIVLSGSLPVASPTATAVAVYELSAAATSATDASSLPVGHVVVPANRTAFKVQIARRSGQHDRLYSKFVAMTSRQQAIGVPHFADDLEFEAVNNYPYPEASSIKGLQPLAIEDDAEEIGTRHAALNVLPSAFMLKAAGDPASTISFPFNGETYYFDRAQVEALDHSVIVLTQDGMQVHFVVYLTPNAALNSAASILIHPDADLTLGTVYAYNTKTDEGIRYVTAAFAFLAQRYTRADQRYGRAVDFIIGNEINSQGVWQNMGQQSLPDFTEYYTRALRLAYLAMRTAYAHPRVYLSLDHFWTISYVPTQPLEYYPGKDTFDQIVSTSHQEGDFPWQVAYHPYPQDLTDPYFWRDDTLATNDSNTQYITYKNLQVLSQYLELPANTYQGKVRSISCSEQGVNEPNDPTLSEEQNQQVQAAAYAYAFYKLRFTPHVDSFILYRQVTDPSESLRMSLWALDPERSGLSAGQPRLIHELYKYIDTPESLSRTQFALPIIGIQSWNDAIPEFDPAKIATQPVPDRPVGAEKFAASDNSKSISDFSHGADGWVYADNADSVQASSTGGYEGGGKLTVAFSTNYGNFGETKFYRGAEVAFNQPLDASDTPYLTLDLNVPPPQPGQFKPGNIFYTKIKVYGPHQHVAAGLVRLDPTQGWTPIAVDLSHWKYRNEISKIKVWVRGTTNDNWTGTFDISKVALARSIGASSRPNVDFQVSAVEPGASGEPVSVIAMNNGSTRLSGTATAQECAQVGLNPFSFSLDLAPAGGTQTFPAAFSDYSSTVSPAQVCFVYNGETLPAPINLTPAQALPFTSLYDFENGTEGWSAGQNAGSVAAVNSFANGPGTPVHGRYALEATANAAPANAPKSVVLVPSTPLNLSNAQNFVAYINAYGLYAGDTFSGFITLTSGSQTLTTTLTSFQPNNWNKAVLDISHWAYRNNITKVEIGFESTNDSVLWAPRFQVDYVGTNP